MLELPAQPDLRAAIAVWFDACRAAPGRLPDGVQPVATRLVRGVGVGALPDGDRAFVKVMAFPRPKDRLRYLHRALPAVYEARMLRGLAARAPDLAVPEVLGVLAVRRRGLPWLSVLVQRELVAAAGGAGGRVVDFGTCARLAARLAELGCHHRDFHAGNVLRLEDGRLGVLDLQSARLLRGPLGRARRIEMAVKLVSTTVSEADADPAELVAAGVIPADDLPTVLASADRVRQLDVRRRILRCLRTSTEFERRRRLDGVLYRRRGVAPGPAIEVGRRGLPLWIGDRALEVRDGRPPSLAGLFRSAWWRPGRDCVYLRSEEAPACFGAIEALLLSGYRTAPVGRDGTVRGPDPDTATPIHAAAERSADGIPGPSVPGPAGPASGGSEGER